MTESRDAQHQSKFRFLMHSAISLASTSVLTSLLGFVYWALAARTFTPSEVGQSSTAVSAVNLIVSGTMLGFGTLLVAELPSMGRGRSTLVSTVAAFTGAIAGLVALGCAFVLPIDFLGLPDIHIFGVALLFAATASTQSVGYLVDQALLPLVGGRMQLRRNVVHSVSKLLLLVFAAAALTRFGALAIFSTWLAFSQPVASLVPGTGINLNCTREAIFRSVTSAVCKSMDLAISSVRESPSPFLNWAPFSGGRSSVIALASVSVQLGRRVMARADRDISISFIML